MDADEPLAVAVTRTTRRIRGVARTTAADRAAVERFLRASLAEHIGRHGDRDAAVPAVRVACAYLAAGDLDEAAMALHTAEERIAARGRGRRADAPLEEPSERTRGRLALRALIARA